FLGGDDLDVAIAERMAEGFLQTQRYDPRSDAQSFEKLRVGAEAVKIALSSQERVQHTVREVAHGVGGASLDLAFAMTRAELEMLASPLIERTFAVCQDALAVARLPVSAFDRVILVGGSTRIPLVRRRVEQFFGSEPLDRVNPEEVVAIGAAIQAAALTEAARARNVPPPPVPGARRKLPSRPSAPSLDAHVDYTDDEVTVATPVAALSAAVAAEQAEAAKARGGSDPPRGRTGKTPPPLPSSPSLEIGPNKKVTASAPAPVLVDVTPRALVVETVGGWCDVVVQRNAKIPCERTRAFTTSSDMQSVVHIRVAQGENATFAENTYLGQVELSGLRPAPRGQVTIQVRFEVDESGTLKVFATDVATRRETHATLQLVGIGSVKSIAAMLARHADTKVM
ncbi:MAG TPA: Hsp70 family protein, partial [Acidimicrobiales bacterium]|nr:Hsp70 family protein [Acidimicrobiales bacterium]